MQTLNLPIIQTAQKEKMQSLEAEMKDVLLANLEGHIFVCPYCNYESGKNSRGSAKIFQSKFFKCFSCGIWRAL